MITTLFSLFSPLFISRIGGTEIIVIVLLVVLLFGARKIPELMKGMGRGVKEFKDAINKDYTEENKKESEEKKDGKEGK